MSNHSSDVFKKTWNDASEADVSYSGLSITAVVAFVFGLSSFLVFFTPWFAFLGGLGILLSLISILSINRSEGALTGMAMARLGLFCSITSLVAVAVLWPTYHYGVRQEADQFFRIWFQALKENNVPLAHGLQSSYWERPSTDDQEKWWKNQYENKFSHKAIHSYTENKLVRTLLALGDKAKVSYYKTLSVNSDDTKDYVVTIYAVSIPGTNDRTETFFIKMTGVRVFPTGDVKSAGWYLRGTPEFYLPNEFKD